MADWRSSQFRMAGGLNEEDPQFTQKPGAAAFMQNYECLPGGGYRRIGGCEVTTGTYPRNTTDPFYNSYYKVAFINGVAEPELGSSVLVLPSFNFQGTVVGVEVTSGSWGDGDAAGWIAFTEWFQFDLPEAGDHLENATTGNTIADIANLDGLVAAEISDTYYAEWNQNTLDYWRAFYEGVGGVNGTGPVLGVFTFENVLYAWRASAANSTLARLWGGVGGVWTEVTPMPYLKFDNGTAEISIGDTVTGGTSATTGVVVEINIAAGNFAGPTYAQGRLFLSGIAGAGFSNNEELRVGGVKKALMDGTLVTPAPISGTMLERHKTIETNFYGADDRKAIYGADGYNDPYVFDGTNLMYFDNTMTTKPQYIEVHRNHLFLAYAGGSVQNSATGLPLVWSVRQGASEIGIGDDPTGMASNGNNTLAITAEESVHILTGTSDLDWNLRVIDSEQGSLPRTIGGVAGQTLFLDKAGINWLLPAPPTFQDYTTQQISRNIRKTIEAKAANALFALSVPGKTQYRLFFDDKTFIIASFFGNKLVGWSTGLYADQMTVGCTGTVGGVKGLWMGTDDGYVMECDYGPSFAGEKIQSIIQTPFNYHGSPDREKRFNKITLEMETPASIDLKVHMDFDYGTGAQTGNFVAATGSTGGQWDISHWESFFWDSGVLTAPEVNIDGVGRNTAITLYHEERTAEPFVISAVLLQYSLYGIKR